MIGGEAAIGVYYSGDAITMIDDNPDLAWVFPEEGSVLSVDSMAIPATSEHQEAAEMFINFMCEVDIGKANAEYIGYTTPMQAVWEVLDEDLKYSEIAFPSEEIEAKEKVFTALSDEVNSELDVKWSEMKSYDEGGSGIVFLMLLLAMVALACFNIWRRSRWIPPVLSVDIGCAPLLLRLFSFAAVGAHRTGGIPLRVQKSSLPFGGGLFCTPRPAAGENGPHFRE